MPNRYAQVNRPRETSAEPQRRYAKMDLRHAAVLITFLLGFGLLTAYATSVTWAGLRAGFDAGVYLPHEYGGSVSSARFALAVTGFGIVFWILAFGKWWREN